MLTGSEVLIFIEGLGPRRVLNERCSLRALFGCKNKLRTVMNLPAPLLKVFRFLGVDRAIAYTIIGRGWSALSGPISILLLARFLTPVEQGFYYTFGSVLGLQIFFELGLSLVLVHFASHEKARVEWTSRGTLEGDPATKARLASLLRKSLLWYGCIAILIVAVILPVGLFFFGRYQPPGSVVEWELPWLWIVLISACSLVISPVFAVLEGCGLVRNIAFLRACQAITGSLVLWLALVTGWGLLAAPLLNTVGFLWGVGWLALRQQSCLVDLLPFRYGTTTVNWWTEVWQFQWKIALSWFSNYFIYQLFNPVLFAFYGAVAAGQMGMSISVTGAISTIAATWVSTKAVPFGGLIAKREFEKLDQLFFPSLWQSVSVVVLGGGAFWAISTYLYIINHPLSHRLLAPLPLGLLIATSVVNVIVYVEAVYLRSHKREPFLILSLLIGGLVGLSSYFLGKTFGATGMMVGYFVVNLVLGLGAGTWIFVQKRREWHAIPG